jgi:hypothetical protein
MTFIISNLIKAPIFSFIIIPPPPLYTPPEGKRGVKGLVGEIIIIKNRI